MIISLMRSLGSTAWETTTNNRFTNYIKNNPGTALKVGILGLSVLGAGYKAHQYLTPKILELAEKYRLETITQKENCPPCKVGTITYKAPFFSKDACGPIFRYFAQEYFYLNREKPIPNTCEPCTIEEIRTPTELGAKVFAITRSPLAMAIQKNSAMIGAMSAVAATSALLARLFLSPEKTSGKSN